MCRWLGYFGDPIRLDELVYNTEHSLLEQSESLRDFAQYQRESRPWRHSSPMTKRLPYLRRVSFLQTQKRSAFASNFRRRD